MLLLHINGLIGLLSAVTPVLAKTPDAFCGYNPLPKAPNCEAAIKKINTGRSYVGGTQINAGDCTVEVKKSIRPDAGVISGEDFYNQAKEIIQGNCEGDGWNNDSGLNVTVHQCRICMYGRCAVCSAPLKRDGIIINGEHQKKLNSQEKFQGSESVDVLQRRSSPEPGVQCLPAASGFKASECRKLATTLRGRKVTLPLIAGNGGCDLAVFGHFRSLGKLAMTSGDLIADRINHDIDLCKSSGSDPMVGYQIDTTCEASAKGALGFTIWFGNLCGSFSFGTGQCVP